MNDFVNLGPALGETIIEPIRMDRTVLQALSPYIFLGAGLLLSAVVVQLLNLGRIGEVLSGPAFG